jgi:hypothetical protein
MQFASLSKTIGAAAALAALGMTSASAMPAAGLNRATNEVANTEQVRLVCNEWGRCWHRPDYFYGGPAFYYGGGPRFYGGPRYGWRGGPGWRGGGWRGGRGRW